MHLIKRDQILLRCLFPGLRSLTSLQIVRLTQESSLRTCVQDFYVLKTFIGRDRTVNSLPSKSSSLSLAISKALWNILFMTLLIGTGLFPRFINYWHFMTEINHSIRIIHTFKYHVFAPMGRFHLELIYLYSFNCQLPKSGDRRNFNTQKPVENVVLTTKDLQESNIQVLDGTTVKNR